MRRALLASTLLTLWGSGCAEEEPGSRLATVAFPLEVCPQGSTCGFTLSVLDGTWRDARPAAKFALGCSAFAEGVVRLENFPLGENLTLYLEVFSDRDCKTLSGKGLRGGVFVRKGAVAGHWYVPTAAKGRFQGLPVLAADTRTKAAATKCTADSDCTRVRDTGSGLEYEVSPAAWCDAGTCKVPDTLFPLNQAVRRAFHTAATLPDGRIALIGGLSERVKDDTWRATDTPVELFDPATMVWAHASLAGFEKTRIAMLTATPADDTGRIVLAGGASELAIRRVVSATNAQDSTVVVELAPAASAALAGRSLSKAVTMLDFGAGRAGSTELPVARLGVNAARVSTSEGPRILLTGGADAGDGSLVATHHTFLCDASGDAPVCTPVAGLLARAGHCGACMDATVGPECSRYGLFGGLASATELEKSVYQVFSDGTFESHGWVPGSSKGNAFDVRCTQTSGLLIVVGGRRDATGPPDILPSLVFLDQNKQYLQVREMPQQSQDKHQLPRLYHTLTRLPDNRLLVTGGIDQTGAVVATAHILEGEKLLPAIGMTTPRFGHTATVITKGALAGAVLVAGGFVGWDQSGKLVLAEGAEIFYP